jgi:TetR/AcrR family transcriptional regulator, cholesterol catabolism regulator
MSVSQARRTAPSSVLIRQKAIEMFFERGFEATSLRTLAEAVGLQVASLYNHITSKEDLLFDIMRDVMVQLLEVTDRATDPDMSPAERLMDFMTASMDYHATHRLEALIGNSELRSLNARHRKKLVALRNDYQARLEKILADCVASGDIDIVDVKLAAFAGFGILLHVAVWYRPDGPLALPKVIEGLLSAYAPTAQVMNK